MTLKEYRLSKKLSRKQLSELSGVNPRQIQRVEDGTSKIENITLINAARLARALEIKIEDLLQGTGK